MHNQQLYIRMYRDMQEIAEVIKEHGGLEAAIDEGLSNPEQALIIQAMLKTQDRQTIARQVFANLAIRSYLTNIGIDDETVVNAMQAFNANKCQYGDPVAPQAMNPGCLGRFIIGLFSSKNPEMFVRLRLIKDFKFRHDMLNMYQGKVIPALNGFYDYLRTQQGMGYLLSESTK